MEQRNLSQHVITHDGWKDKVLAAQRDGGAMGISSVGVGDNG